VSNDDFAGSAVIGRLLFLSHAGIPRAADRRLPAAERDADGLADERTQTCRSCNGPDPVLVLYCYAQAEVPGVSAWVKRVIDSGTSDHETGVFVRGQGRARHGRDDDVLSPRSRLADSRDRAAPAMEVAG
jgi:hypothetical protein